MTEAQLERRLAAILAADVAGYSRLMGAEVGTLAALKAHRREIVDSAIAAHRGRIVKTTGDGISSLMMPGGEYLAWHSPSSA
jgi:adenylate cyclase